MNNVVILIGGEDYSNHVMFPFQVAEVLDESLDMITLQLLYTIKHEPFEPFTNAIVRIIDKNSKTREYEMYVASDETEHILKNDKTNHTVVLIEQTKATERILLTKTSTNPLVRDYTGDQSQVTPILDGISEDRVNTPSQYVTPIQKGTMTITNIYDIVERLMLVLDYPRKVEIISPRNIVVSTTTNSKDDFSFEFNEVGQYTIKYSGKYYHGLTTANQRPFAIYFYINVLSETEPALDKTITEVVNALLYTCETLRDGDSPKIVFNEEQAQKYSTIKCPELSFPKQTLWEALRQIGGVIHSLPRVENNVLYFDDLGSQNMSNIKNKTEISDIGSHNCEQFCSTIESSVDNLINLDNTSQASINDYGGLLKTIRTETGAFVINEDNAFIQTMYPIGRITKVECGYLSDGTYVGDITPYCQYEQTQYSALSSYSETFPTSKAYALYYVLGEKNIRGLTFKVPNTVSSVFSNFAIKNIILHKLGKEESWWQQLFSNFKIFYLQFKITYQPYFSATIRQVKSNLKDLKFKSVISYNQNANSINTIAYGEHLKGVVERLGNAEKKKSYLLKTLDEVANVGDKFDDNYRISEVMLDVYRDFFICQISLSKKFNRWNDFVGINKEIRMYEVSEKQVEERPVIWEDYAIVQKKADNSLKISTIPNEVDSYTPFEITAGINNGNEYILGGENAGVVWFGNLDNWDKFITDNINLIFASGFDANKNPLVLSFYNGGSAFGTIFYYDDNDNRNVSQFEFGNNGVWVQTVAYGDNMFVAIDKANVVGVDEATVYVLTPNTNDASKLDITSFQQGFYEQNSNWRITYLNRKNKGVFIAVSDGYRVKYREDGRYTTDGELFFYSRSFNFEIPNLIDIKSYRISRNQDECFAFNSQKVIRGYYSSDDTEYYNMTWEEKQFPVNDILDFAYMNGIYFAISENMLYYSFDLETWYSTKLEISNLKHIISGVDEIILTNNTNNVYLLKIVGNNSFLTQNGVSQFANGLEVGSNIYGTITIANAVTYDKNKNKITDIWLPTIVSSSGNTLQIQFEYADNYNAGNNAQTNLESTSGFIKTQSYVPYGNEYGEAEYLSVDFWDENLFSVPENYDSYLQVGDDLPYINIEKDSGRFALLSSTSDLKAGNKNYILLKKDNREKIRFDYFLHFVANDDDIIIGSGLAQLNTFVSRSPTNTVDNRIKLYILGEKINEFEKDIDLTNATLQEEFINAITDTNFGKIYFSGENNTMLANGKAWAMVMKNPYNENENLLLFGKNMEITEGDIEEWSQYEIAFTHEIENFL